MPTIFERIRNKVSQTAQGVGNAIGGAARGFGAAANNFIDRDQQLPGTQIVPGGIQGGVDRVRQSFQGNNFQNQASAGIKNILRTPVNQQNPVIQGINFLDRNVTKPLERTPLGTILNPKFLGERTANQALFAGDLGRERQEKINTGQRPSLFEEANFGLNSLGAALPGIDDIAFGAFDYLKAGGAGKDQQQAFVGSPEVGGGEYTGAGTALFGEDTAAGGALDLAELPLLLAVGGLNAKGLKRADDVAPQIAKLSDFKKSPIKRIYSKTDDVARQISSDFERISKTTTNEERGLISLLDKERDYFYKNKKLLDSRVAGLARGEITKFNRLINSISGAQQVDSKQVNKSDAINEALEIIGKKYKEIPSLSSDEFFSKFNNIGDVSNIAKRVEKQVDPVSDFVKSLGEPGEVAAPLAKKLDNIAPALKNVEGIGDVVNKAKAPRIKSSLRKTFDALVPGSRKVISESGPSGKKISDILEKSDLEGSLRTGGQQDTLNNAFKALTKEDKLSFADVVEGAAKPISEAQAQAVDIWRGISQDILARGRSVGLDLGEIENYFPHHVIKGKVDDPSIKNILSRSSERRYGNLELARQTSAPYDKDPSVLFDYIESANKRITDAENFGANDDVLYGLAENVAGEGGDAGQVTQFLDQILGKNQDKGLEGISQKIRNVESFKLGPQSALTNLTQNLSTLIRTDPKSVGGAIKRVVTNPDEAISNAIRAGELDPDQGARIMSDVGSGSAVKKWLKLVGFSGAEKINRVIAVNSGIEYSNKLIKQAKGGSESAFRELDRLGFDTKNLDRINPLVGGKKISEATQFDTKTGELPYGWQTPIGRIATQFKGFAYKQTSFLGSESKRIFQETKHGNLKPLTNALVTYGVAAPIVGEIISDIKSVMSNKKRDDEGTERYFNNILSATSLGLLDNFGGLTGKYGPGGVISTVAGPAAGDLFKAADTISNAGSDEEFERNRAARNVVRSIPGVGTTLSNTFVPNSRIDNQDINGVNLGVNEGLGKKDKETFKNIKETSPEQAELFRDKAQADRDSDKGGGFLSNIFGGDKKAEFSVPKANATGDEKKAFNSQVKDVLNQGVVPDSDKLKYTVFDNKSATSDSIEERMDVYRAINSATKNENYTDEQKKAIIEASGASKEDASYYTLSAKDVDVKTQELLPKIDKMNNEEVVEFLMQGRRIIGGKQLITPKMVDYLYENDYIGKDEKDAVKALQYDEIKSEFYFKKSFQKKGKGKTLSYKQAQKLFNVNIPKFSQLKSVSTLLSQYSPGSSQTDRSGDRLLSSILSNRTKTPTIKFS